MDVEEADLRTVSFVEELDRLHDESCDRTLHQLSRLIVEAEEDVLDPRGCLEEWLLPVALDEGLDNHERLVDAGEVMEAKWCHLEALLNIAVSNSESVVCDEWFILHRPRSSQVLNRDNLEVVMRVHLPIVVIVVQIAEDICDRALTVL